MLLPLQLIGVIQRYTIIERLLCANGSTLTFVISEIKYTLYTLLCINTYTDNTNNNISINKQLKDSSSVIDLIEQKDISVPFWRYHEA